MVTAFVVVFTFALLLLAGLVIDGGLALAARVQAIDEAQAAARAGAQAIDLPLFRSTGQIVLDPARGQRPTPSATSPPPATPAPSQVNGDEVDCHRHDHPAHADPRHRRHRQLTVSGTGALPPSTASTGARHMTRARQDQPRLVALTFLAGLVGGVPVGAVALRRLAAAPRVPSWSQFTTALDTARHPGRILLKALACVVWISWAILAASVLAEIPPPCAAEPHGASLSPVPSSRSSGISSPPSSLPLSRRAPARGGKRSTPLGHRLAMARPRSRRSPWRWPSDTPGPVAVARHQRS